MKINVKYAIRQFAGRMFVISLVSLCLSFVTENATARDFVRNAEETSLTTIAHPAYITHQDNVLNRVSIVMDCKTELVTLNLYDMAGKKIRTLSLNTLKGSNTLSMDISRLPHGLFLFEVISSDEVYKTKLVK